jgi:5-methyltetrahydropteroyltriglutamate--homocysteine methyltransferase
MPFRAQLIGYPRIGPNRELKWTLERAWSGRLDRPGLDARAAELRTAHLAEQRALVGSAVDDFVLYDLVLETALMLGIAPAWAGDPDADPFGVLSAVARGTPEHEAWEMTKWFDTNYHYVVPEVTRPVERLTPLPWREPTREAETSWVAIGPYSLTKLSRLAPGLDPAEVARSTGDALWSWVRQQAAANPGFRLQLDEPCLGLAMTSDDHELADVAYAGAAGAGTADLGLPERPLVTVQFGRIGARTAQALDRLGFAVQIGLDQLPELGDLAEPAISVMDGRSVFADAFEPVRDALAGLATDRRAVHLVPSTSFLFLPYTTEGEELPPGFAFAREKARALAEWAAALGGGPAPTPVSAPGAAWPAVGELVPRVSRGERRAAQADLNLPPYPTTTTGSLPQTGDVRHLRQQLSRGELDRADYEASIAKHITDAIGWQERMGLDVLVHGEFERSDMVEYFAQQMDGFLTTRAGWVLSYGSRCTRPPILAAPPSISAPMTVDEWRLAQAATERPVKGMLTGPVTIVNWSFRPPGVPDDRLFWAVAQPIAEEVGHLVEAGARIIQIDEPAVRERWPLPTEDAQERRAVYARGVRAALNHVFAQPAEVQMHTHMCYGDFGDIVPLWADAGVDVASIEFSRSKDDSYIRSFYSLFRDGHLQIGPGLFDVHSPYSPGEAVMAERLDHFEGFMETADIWVNPDCGLKTRGWDEIERQLSDMVAAARDRRDRAG